MIHTYQGKGQIMNVQKPLFWDQGILLQPQHFQLLDRTCQGLLSPYQKYLMPHFWGVATISLRKDALGTRTFSVQGGDFLFPDGTFVSLAENGCTDDRAFDEAWVSKRFAE